MAKTARTGATHLHRNGGGLPEEIIIWEILVRLPSKSLLRCRTVCRAWRCVTTSRDFLFAHHTHQPSLPIVSCNEYGRWSHNDIHLFDHRSAADAKLQPVVRLERSFCLAASCGGLVILSRIGTNTCKYICNPATREHAPLPQTTGFRLLGMYPHQPTGEHRLLLHTSFAVPKSLIGFYVLTVGAEQSPKYIEAPSVTISRESVYKPALVHDSLHWYPHYQNDSKSVLVFDCTTELFRQMRAPVVATYSYTIFEMDNTLGMYSYNAYSKTVDIWVLQNYENEIWDNKYRVELPSAEIRGRRGILSGGYSWDISVVSVDGDVILLVSNGQRLFYVNTDGKMVDNFHRNGQRWFYDSRLRLKQTLVPHNFFTALGGCAVNALPFI